MLTSPQYACQANSALENTSNLYARADEKETFLIEKHYRAAVPTVEFMDFISDPRLDPYWQASCERAELDNPGGPMHSGSGYRIWFRFFGKKMEFRMHCVELDPDRTFTYTVVEGPLKFTGHYRLHPTVDGESDVYWSFKVTPGSFFGVVPKSLLKKALNKQLDRDIAKLQSLLATRTGAESN